MNEKNLTIIEHIDEIRKRLMVIVVFFVVAVIGSFFLAKPLIQVSPVHGEAKNITLNAFNVIDPIMIYLKVIFFIAVSYYFTGTDVSIVVIYFSGTT